MRDLDNIPTEIIEAATKVENWMKMHGHRRWELLGICSRDHAAELRMWREGGLTEEEAIAACKANEGTPP